MKNGSMLKATLQITAASSKSSCNLQMFESATSQQLFPLIYLFINQLLTAACLSEKRQSCKSLGESVAAARNWRGLKTNKSSAFR